MADFISDIDWVLYPYIKNFYVTEMDGVFHTDFPILLELNENNFNFDLCRADGLDIRVGLKSNGTGILNIWIEKFDLINNNALLWIKLPNILAFEKKELFMYWGYATATSVSNLDSIGFLCSDDFLGATLDTTKWDTNISPVTIEDSYIKLNNDYYIKSKDNSIIITTNWEFKCKLNVLNLTASSSYLSHKISFVGPENGFYFDFYSQGSSCRVSNFRNGSTLITYNGNYKGIELNSINTQLIKYDESLDYVYHGLSSRNIYPDYLDYWERQVYGDTVLSYFMLTGGDGYGASNIKIDWIYFNNINYTKAPIIDYSNLFQEHQSIVPNITYGNIYGADETNTLFYHESSIGGNPYYLSDDSLATYWISDNLTTFSGSLLIDFGRTTTNRTLLGNYIHYDSGHTNYYNAANLSDDDSGDEIKWLSTTTSGWVVMDYNQDKFSLGCLLIKASHNNISGVPNSFILSGSKLDGFWSNDYYNDNGINYVWYNLYEGNFIATTNWQAVYISNDAVFRSYRLAYNNTHGSVASLQEWKMYSRESYNVKKIISKISLKPITNKEEFFPKYITVKASNDLVNWSTLIDNFSTYTPFNGRWQEYYIENYIGYYNYCIDVFGNWNNDIGYIGIGAWSMHSSNTELLTYRILKGTSNNINNIQAIATCTFDNSVFYITNDYINIIINDKLSLYSTLEGTVLDLNTV